MGALSRGGSDAATRPVRVAIEARLSGRLVRRYKRFLADVRLDGPEGETLVVHCPDPGSMRGCSTPGARVRCSTSDNPRRKLKHTLEMIRVGHTWVSTHSSRANQLVALALEAGAIPALRGYTEQRREVAVGKGSRLDFRLDGHSRRDQPAFVEVKSVTLADGRTARFPDSVTQRGRRHVETLARLHREGARAVLLFVVQRGDCDRMVLADDLDPEFGKALRLAVSSGVEVHAIGAKIGARAIELRGRLPVNL